MYVLSQLVGEHGHVHGVDMTPEQLDVANKWLGWHMEKFFGSPDKVNVTFHQVGTYLLIILTFSLTDISTHSRASAGPNFIIPRLCHSPMI